MEERVRTRLVAARHRPMESIAAHRVRALAVRSSLIVTVDTRRAVAIFRQDFQDRQDLQDLGIGPRVLAQFLHLHA